jgi:hypothetical protein
MRELCILFSYHKCDDVTVHHLELLKKHNPSVIIVPLTDDVPEQLPESVDVKDFPSRWTTKDKWAGVDIMLYKWFLNRTETARRYLVLEYDCMCTMPIAHAYAGVWNADVACAKFVRRWTHPLWHWFSPESLAKLDPEDRPIAAGVVPYVGALYSHRALEAILDNVTSNDAFAELRLGTAISKAGLDVTRLPRELRRTIQWDLFTGDRSRPGIYHAVKSKADESRVLEMRAAREAQGRGSGSQLVRVAGRVARRYYQLATDLARRPRSLRP